MGSYYWKSNTARLRRGIKKRVGYFGQRGPEKGEQALVILGKRFERLGT